MDINKLLKNIPIGRSQYEFDNFIIGSSNSAARQVRALLLEKEEAERQLAQLADHSDTTRYADTLKKELSQIDEFLGQFDEEQIAAVLSNFEDEEGDYWAETLGKAAAIEVLTIDKVSPETLARLALLPIEDYKTSVEFTNRIIQYIKQTTAQLEKELFDDAPSEMVTGVDIRG